MYVGAHDRRAREHSGLLLSALDRDHPSFREVLAHDGARRAVEDVLGFPVTIAAEAGGACSVAGSCDRATRRIRVAPSAPARMRYTVLHEAGHLLGDDDDDFHDALHAAGRVSARAVEEDACEAFAAALLLPGADVDAVLGAYGATARGLVALEAQSDASREACAVAVAQRLGSPGYAALVRYDGTLSFAARSGDALPLARGSDQAGSVLAPLLRGAPSLRDRGGLCFPGGSLTGLMHVDAVLCGRLVYVVAVTDSPDWPVLHEPDRQPVGARLLNGWCDDCGAEFAAGSRCQDCGEPVHPDCGRCACAVRPARGERTCTVCFQTKAAPSFRGGSSVCEEHL